MEDSFKKKSEQYAVQIRRGIREEIIAKRRKMDTDD